MKYLAAYLLLVQAGKAEPTADEVTKVLESVGIEVDSEKLDKLIAEVAGKKAEELIAEGLEKLSSVPTGGAAASGAAAAGEPEAATEAAAEEEEEESDDDMGFGLFD